ALGLERAGFEHALAVELDGAACATLRANRPAWKVAEGDVADRDLWRPEDYRGVALLAPWFRWPSPSVRPPATVGETLGDLMAARGWPGASAWARRADRIAPTIVGGSKKHGGADLGPTRAKRAWAELGVDGIGVADAAPGPSD